MINLLRAETTRLSARRITWIALIFAFSGLLVALWSVYQSALPISDEAIAEATKEFQNNIADFEEYCSSGETASTDPACKEKPKLEDWLPKPATFKEVIYSTTTAVSTIGFLALMAVGASFVAAEFATGAVSNLLGFVPNRTKVFSAKLLATIIGSTFGGWILSGVTLTLGTALYTAVRGGQDVNMLSVGTSLLRSTVVIVIGGILGASLAFILRRTSAVVGAILGYAFISPVINGQLSGAGYTEVLSFLPDNNLMALIEGQKIIYGWPQWEDGKETRATEIVISASQASIYWLILLVVIVGIAWYTFKRRDLV